MTQDRWLGVVSPGAGRDRCAPGFAAVTATPGVVEPMLSRAARSAGFTQARCRGAGALQTAVWGGDGPPTGTELADALVLSREVRRHETAVSRTEVRRMLVTGDRQGLAQMLPTFGAATHLDADGLVACTDHLGFRQLYLLRGPGWAAVSTSARLLAALGGVGLDLEGVAVQSLLGWQLAHRTLFAGVTQVPAGGLVTLRNGQAMVDSFVPDRPVEPLDLDTAVSRTRELLRGYLAAYLDDHPDAILQLTGGQDSRLLLSAIEPARRRGLRVMTLGVPGSPDVAIAAALAARYGMDHEILRLDGLDAISPAEAHDRCLEAAGRLELGADPVARAALDVAESRAEPGPRLSGLGGEVARGFYYLGRAMDADVTPARARRLADWRMFANEAVDPAALDPAFVSWARDFATHEVHRVLTASGERWSAATDALYLGHRMQRWAGATETAVCSDRRIANPMLDDRFIQAVSGLSPADKRHSRFLARLQVALDEELAGQPLDGRPPPAAYAEPGWRNSLTQGRAVMTKAGRKLAQRARGERRPPAGGELLAARVVQHWRSQPHALESVADVGVFRPEWLAEVADGAREPSPSAVSLVLNLTGALAATAPQ